MSFLLFPDNMDDGPPALACFIIIALCPLSRRWLFMEQTAQGRYRRILYYLHVLIPYLAKYSVLKVL